MSDDFDTIPVRLPSGTKASVQLPRVFALADGVHLMDFLSAYITDKAGDPVGSPHPAEGSAHEDRKREFLAHLAAASRMVEGWPAWKTGLWRGDEARAQPAGDAGLPPDDAKLCAWLREHSSGVYRASAQAADRIEELSRQVQSLLNHCPDAECWTCGEVICPHGEPLHFHHDGCPACAQDDAATPQPSAQQDDRDPIRDLDVSIGQPGPRVVDQDQGDSEGGDHD